MFNINKIIMKHQPFDDHSKLYLFGGQFRWAAEEIVFTKFQSARLLEGLPPKKNSV